MTRHHAKNPLDSSKRSSYPIVKKVNDNDEHNDDDTHQGWILSRTKRKREIEKEKERREEGKKERKGWSRVRPSIQSELRSQRASARNNNYIILFIIITITITTLIIIIRFGVVSIFSHWTSRWSRIEKTVQPNTFSSADTIFVLPFFFWRKLTDA